MYIVPVKEIFLRDYCLERVLQNTYETATQIINIYIMTSFQLNIMKSALFPLKFALFLVFSRNMRYGSLTLDDNLPVSNISEPGATELNTDGVYWIGPLLSLSLIYFKYAYDTTK